MRYVLLVCLLVACTKEPEIQDPAAQWNVLKQRYPSPDGEWQTVMRMLSVARHAQDVKALRSVIADTTPTTVLAGIAGQKTIGELAGLHELLLQTVTSADDPALLTMIALADDMRKRGNMAHAEAGLAILEATAKWSAEHHQKLPALEAIQISRGDFVGIVGRDVVSTALLLEAQRPEPKLLAELHTFLNERMATMEKPNQSLETASNWRTEPDALDHPLISQCAHNFGVQLDAMMRTKRAIDRLAALKK